MVNAPALVNNATSAGVLEGSQSRNLRGTAMTRHKPILTHANMGAGMDANDSTIVFNCIGLAVARPTGVRHFFCEAREPMA